MIKIKDNYCQNEDAVFVPHWKVNIISLVHLNGNKLFKYMKNFNKNLDFPWQISIFLQRKVTFR